MMEAIVQHQHHQPSPAAGFLLPILDGATPTPPAPTTSSPPSWSSGSSYTSNSSSSSTATASSGQGHYTWVPRSGPDYFGRHHSSSGSGTIVSPIVSSFISSPRRPSPPTRPSASGARLNRSAAKSASKSPSSSSTSTSTIMSTAASTTRAANKRSSDDDGSSGASSNTKVKLPRLDRGPEDFSTVVKNRLQSYTRTGQACDRCKVSEFNSIPSHGAQLPVSSLFLILPPPPPASATARQRQITMANSSFFLFRSRFARFDATPSPKAAPTA